VARGLESNQDSCRHVVTEHPVPYWRSAGLVVCLGKDVLGAVKSIRLGDRDWEPDDIEKEIKYDDVGRRSKDPLVGLRIQVIHADANAEEALRKDPLHGSEPDVGGIGGEVESKDRDFRKQEIRRRLRVRGDESCPCGSAPPSHDESEEPSIATATGFSSPEIDGTSSGERRADLGENGGCDGDEDARYDVAGPTRTSLLAAVA
jgi:hypothetical protein